MVKRHRLSLTLAGLLLSIMVLLPAAGWLSYQYVLKDTDEGTFAGYWIGTRLLLEEGKAPYGANATLRIIDLTDGWPSALRAGVFNISYPLYAVVMFWPFALISDYTVARAAWLVFSAVCLLLIGVFGLRLLNWRPGVALLPFYFLFVLVGFLSLYALDQGSMVVQVTLLVLLALWALRRGLDEIAGGLLAFATAMPFLMALPVLFTLLWAIFRRRWRLLFWLVGTLVLLFFASYLLAPDWMEEYYGVLYSQINILPSWTPSTLLSAIWPGTGGRIGLVFSLLIGLLMLAEWWGSLNSDDITRFLWTAVLTLVLSLWIGLPTHPVNTFVLVLPLILVATLLDEKWKTGGRTASMLGFGLLLAGPWLAFWAASPDAAAPAFYGLLLLFLPFFALVGVYWVRWWAIRPQRLYMEELQGWE